jgi:hypothetical protein
MADGAIVLTDSELTLRLTLTEDPYVERKSAGDLKDVLKTAVAFANSLPTGVPGVLFIPTTNAGVIQDHKDLDQLQREITKRLDEVYPPVDRFMRVIQVNGKEVVTVQVWGSSDRPHFAGPSYIRDGSVTKKASDTQFAELIARRSSKVEELSKWIGKSIAVVFLSPGQGPRIENTADATLESCSQWFVTVSYDAVLTHMPKRESFALSRIQISHDHVKDRLMIEIRR